MILYPEFIESYQNYKLGKKNKELDIQVVDDKK